MKGVILAGGLGTRLYPVTLEMPKPLITVKRKPIINHLLELFSRHGVTESFVIINKDHQDDYQWWQRRYLDELPIPARIKIEPRPLGTFGGLKYLREELKDSFVLSNGDELKDFHLGDLIKSHKNNSEKPLATIALVKVPNPSDYGVPVLKGNRIIEFLEKPKNSMSGYRKSGGLTISQKLNLDQPSYISSGLYILEPEVFDYADWPRGFLMIEKDIFPKLAAAGKLAGYKIKNGRWFDCGTFERWEKAIREW
ncbi:MAG: hypothetical protein A2745_03730 [Candidatus Harrisonbacteria bacterium RIFCSPHIGHO2_01_FULL_44_13]|uniref:Nucleotidyl transferase domain-containing protein n=1 Tax=Candidatus Harrisonbacteria bacterium RIFCSPLOWO2_01_FULL_44_18 TaxID=1798407 RepID=A0A1G1ZR85_9BACT|nr:MAG: hypothetical protein A2745_03730 [Candidatus Harrisonbacteria bacterium RIFCSPHIGHO2_01_FULL_44_13]OGY66347.1 MAG: hypothetical protein A3A16_00350 [Candidatus Harrisonbacteria bacterium RIFCSPLOWO2_01_FULL_44_18]